MRTFVICALCAGTTVAAQLSEGNSFHWYTGGVIGLGVGIAAAIGWDD